ncbi:MAG: hypothetical protein CMJ53_04605 [Planctomycetaceae bacterium]|nr:hypothetical protein [Planctomycetaceae bacterium]
MDQSKQPDAQHDAQEDEDTPFGSVFADDSQAFRTRDDVGLRKAFHPDAVVRVHDRRTDERLEVSPHEFFTRLYEEIGDADFAVETLTSRFADGCLFADGVWVSQRRKPVLRAADLFSARADGRIASLTVVWTPATQL